MGCDKEVQTAGLVCFDTLIYDSAGVRLLEMVAFLRAVIWLLVHFSWHYRQGTGIGRFSCLTAS